MPDNNANFVGGFNQSVNENRNDCGCGRNDGLFGNCGCGCGDSTILFFIIVFLLLFTNFGCCGCCRG